MVQTPLQRRANQRFERAESAKRGKPAAAVKKRSDRERMKSPISRTAVRKLPFNFFTKQEAE